MGKWEHSSTSRKLSLTNALELFDNVNYCIEKAVLVAQSSIAKDIQP